MPYELNPIYAPLIQWHILCNIKEFSEFVIALLNCLREQNLLTHSTGEFFIF